MGINLSGFDILVAQEGLDGLQGDAGHGQVGGEGVAQIMEADVGEAGPPGDFGEPVGSGIGLPGPEAPYLGQVPEQFGQG